MRLYADAAASITGLLHTFIFIGAIIGPLSFGVVAHGANYRVAWFGAGTLLAVGALLMHAFRRMYLSNGPESVH